MATKPLQRQRKCFGIACFYFSHTRAFPYEYSCKDYCDQLRTALQAMPTVSNVDISFAEKEAETFIVEEPVDPFDDGGPATLPPFFSLTFDLHIQFRIQEEIAGRSTRDDTGTERFRVRLQENYDVPTAFVELLGSPNAVSPSTGVIVVREYLRRELSRNSSPFQLQVLGPSPFHAEFSLAEAGTEKSLSFFYPGIAVEVSRLSGYADVEFFYDPEIFADIEEAFDALWFELTDELNEFYDIRHEDVLASNDWTALDAQMDELLEPVASENFAQRFARRLSHGRKLYELRKVLVRFDAARLFSKQRLEESLRTLYAKDREIYLRSFVDEELKNLPNFPTQQIGSLLSYMETRRSKVVELSIILLAAIIGGFTGATVNAMFTTKSAPPKTPVIERIESPKGQSGSNQAHATETNRLNK